jgi:hypothetical protein
MEITSYPSQARSSRPVRKPVALVNDLATQVKDVGVLYLVDALLLSAYLRQEGAIRFSLSLSVVRSRTWRRS